MVWAVALAVVFPAVTVALTEFTLRLRRGNQAVAVPFALVRDLILPTLATLALLVGVAGWNASSIPVRVVETLLWLFVTHTALSFVAAIVFAGAKGGGWRARMPRLFIDIARGLIVLFCLAIVLSTVWGRDLGQMAAALGVGSIVLGLALQEPLGSLFNGIMLMAERPVGISDWVKIGDNTGAVIESNWRSVHLRTRSGDLVVVPNSQLAQEVFVNYSRPASLHMESVTLSFSCDDAPNKVKLALLESAKRTSGVLADPPASVTLANFGESSIHYEVDLPIVDFANVDNIVDEFRTLVWYAAQRDGLTMPYPTQRLIVVSAPGREAVQNPPLTPESLRAFLHLGLAGAGAPEALSEGAVKHYAKGERVVKEGQRISGLHLIVSGRVALAARGGSGEEVEIDRLERGEFFGEKSLLSGAPSDATVTALEDVELLVLETDAVYRLIERTPALSRQIAEVAAARRQTLRNFRARPVAS